MVVNDYDGNLIPRGALRFIASRLAPTVESSIRIAARERGSGAWGVGKYVGAHLMGVHPGLDQRIQRAVDHGR